MNKLIRLYLVIFALFTGQNVYSFGLGLVSGNPEGISCVNPTVVPGFLEIRVEPSVETTGLVLVLLALGYTRKK